MTELGQMLVDDGIEIGLAKGRVKNCSHDTKKTGKRPHHFRPYPEKLDWTALTSKK